MAGGKYSTKNRGAGLNLTLRTNLDISSARHSTLRAEAVNSRRIEVLRGNRDSALAQRADQERRLPTPPLPA